MLKFMSVALVLSDKIDDDIHRDISDDPFILNEYYSLYTKKH